MSLSVAAHSCRTLRLLFAHGGPPAKQLSLRATIPSKEVSDVSGGVRMSVSHLSVHCFPKRFAAAAWCVMCGGV